MCIWRSMRRSRRKDSPVGRRPTGVVQERARRWGAVGRRWKSEEVVMQGEEGKDGSLRR
jgi:hypothetical protein